MENTQQTCTKKCPLGGFCWKNPTHVVLFLAVLPFALKGVQVAWETVSTAVNTLTK